MSEQRKLIEKLQSLHRLDANEWHFLFTENFSVEDQQFLYKQARDTCDQIYGKQVFIRGLIEVSSYCKNDCLYCGLRKSNLSAQRYRLTPEEILSCCASGYELGFRTFVLQGGEDAVFSDALLCPLIEKIKNRYPDCALTLSLGERSKESYQHLFDAGADRYLLRHETADAQHYGKLHPAQLSLANRMDCLYTLKEVGFQTGCGLMVGSPYQSVDCLVADMLFIEQFQPHMVGIGPFIPHHATPFASFAPGSLELTLKILSLVRLMIPEVLLPSTTALGTIHPQGRQKGILAGANVVMPNLSPAEVRTKYMLYDNKICTGNEAAESIHQLHQQLSSIGYSISISRGDCCRSQPSDSL